MRLTARDSEILSFINAVGWCMAPHIQRRFSINWWIFYRLMKRLVREGLVVHQRYPFTAHGIYYLTPKGARFTDLPPLEHVSTGGYKHQLALLKLVLTLLERYPHAEWVSERYLIQQKFRYGVGRKGHVADGLLIFPDDKKVAIEVELSMKGARRIEGILRAYRGQFEIEQAWYFCADSIMRSMSKLAGDGAKIKIHSLREFLHE